MTGMRAGEHGKSRTTEGMPARIRVGRTRQAKVGNEFDQLDTKRGRRLNGLQTKNGQLQKRVEPAVGVS